MPDQRVNGNLVLIGSLGGTFAFGCQASGGGFTYLLPTSIPQIGQSLVVTSVFNGNMALLSWGPPFTGTISNFAINGTLADNVSSVGTNGQVLTSTGSGVLWRNVPVVSVFGRTGVVVAQSGDYSYAQISGTPQLAQTYGAVSNQWLNSYSATTGLFTSTQPSFSNLSGSIATGQIPAHTVTVAQINATGTPSATTFLRGDGAWATPAGGGGGTPGGANTDIQYNNLGAFAGDAGLTWDVTTGSFTAGTTTAQGSGVFTTIFHADSGSGHTNQFALGDSFVNVGANIPGSSVIIVADQNIQLEPTNGVVQVGSSIEIGYGTPGIGFFGHVPQPQPTITGNRAGNTALASLLTALNGQGLVVDSTTSTTPSRIASISYVIDGGGSVPSTGVKGQVSIPAACTITGWVITADQSGSAVVDVLRSTYAAFPTTASIAGTDMPTLSSVQKNEDLTLTGWGSTAINAGDQIQFNLNSAATVTRLNITLNVTIP